MNPQDVWYKANLNQDIAFNRNINIWFGWLAKYNSHYHLGATEAAVSKRWYAEQAALAKHPISGVVGPDEWTDIFLEAGYTSRPGCSSVARSPTGRTPTAQPRARRCDLYQQTDTPGNDNEFAVYNAVQCTDVQWPTSWAVWDADNTAVDKIAPFETWANAWSTRPACTGRPRPSVRCRSARTAAATRSTAPCSSTRRWTRRRRSRAASRSASCSRTRCCWPSRAAPRTPTR